MSYETTYTKLDIRAYLDQNLVLKGFDEQQGNIMRDSLIETIYTAPDVYQTIVMEDPHDIILGTKDEIRLLYGSGWKENIGGFYSRENKKVHIVINSCQQDSSWTQIYWHEEGHRMDDVLSGDSPYFLSELRRSWVCSVEQYSQIKNHVSLPIQNYKDLTDYLKSGLYTSVNYPSETVAQMVRYHVMTHQHDRTVNTAIDLVSDAYPALWITYNDEILLEAKRYMYSSQNKRRDEINEFSTLVRQAAEVISSNFDDTFTQQYASILRIEDPAIMRKYKENLINISNNITDLPENLSVFFNEMSQYIIDKRQRLAAEERARTALAQAQEAFIEKAQNFCDLQDVIVDEEERSLIFDRLKQKFKYTSLTPIITVIEDKELLSRYLEAFRGGSPFGGSVLEEELSSLEHMACHIQDDISMRGYVEVTTKAQAREVAEKKIQQYLKDFEWKQSQQSFKMQRAALEMV